MKRFVNYIEEHRWADFCQAIIERRDGIKYNKDCNFGDSISEYGEFYNIYNKFYNIYNKYGSLTIHLRAEEISSGALFEIRLLCGDRKGKYPIIALVNIDGIEVIEEFNNDGISSNGLMKLHYETIYFEPGDYVVTTQDAIGIYTNHRYMFASLEKDGTENLEFNSRGIYTRPATEDEISKLNEMLLRHNKKWNNETKQLEDI